METGTGPDQRIGPNDPAKAIRETERAVQPTVRPVILPRRLRLWRFHAKRRGPYRHQYLPDRFRGAFLRSVESLLIPQAILDSQFSILNCPGLSPAPEIPEENVRDGIVPSLELRINDDDFQAVLSLVEPLYRHSAGILSLLPSDEVPRSRTPTPQEALFAALPLSFNRQQALEEAERNNIPTATLDTCLKRMQERGTLEKNGRGEYSFGGRVTHK